jgi:Mg2+/Co2+ transporter CorC
MRFEVLNAESRRIRLLKVAKAQPDEADAQD